MTDYELLLAIAEDQSEEEQKKILTGLTSIIEKAKGEVAQTDSWGKKALAFPIGKNKNAYYSLLNLKGNENLPKAVTDSLRIEDKVLRFLISRKVVVKKAKKKDTRKTKKPAENIIIR